jgi:excisionase family DNA binding protein
MSDKWMTVKDVAQYLQLSTDQIYRLAQQGRIPVSKVGNRWRFKRERIDQWMEEQEVSGRQPTAGTQEKRVQQYSDPVAKENT